MKIPVLSTLREVVSTIICAYPGGRECAAARLGMNLKKFDNHAYENGNIRPLTEIQIHQLEQETKSTHLANYVAALYGGIFVPVADPDSLDKVELYTMSVQVAAKRGTVDQIIAKALDDGEINESEANAILSAHNLHMAARHAEVLAAIELHRHRSESSL
ncbi:YmfL family putative regulatory protein [Pseudomonas sp. NPDC087358]|uniref:YmfL family putative regulatory protein n=1 Tax=Pseudomonas sp. NPDC087358 TaxID=3364439 RepID=UPI00384F0352